MRYGAILNILRVIILPRQARDKHRESTQTKSGAFSYSSDKWQVSAPPFTFEHLYHGEVYDARLALPGWDQVRSRPSLAPFYTENDHFTKTGSGQTQGKHSKKSWDQLDYDPPSANWSAASVVEPPLGKDALLSPRLFPPIRGKESHLLRHVMLKMMVVLPRQARDKHSENSKSVFFK